MPGIHSSRGPSLAKRANTDGLEVDISGAYAIASASERAIRKDMIGSVFGSIAQNLANLRITQ